MYRLRIRTCICTYLHTFMLEPACTFFSFSLLLFLFLGIKQCAKVCAYVCMCVEKLVWAVDSFREKCKKDAWKWVLITISLLFYTFDSTYFPLISALTYIWRTNILRRIKYAYHENTIDAKQKSSKLVQKYEMKW